MTIRGLLLSHFCAALFGYLLAFFFFSGGTPERPEENATEQMELQIQELKARLLSYQELKQRFEERIAYLLLKPPSDTSPIQVETQPPAPEPPPVPIEETPREISLAFDDAVALANFQGMADEIFGLIRTGEFESAVATIRYLEWLMEADGELNPISGIRPLYQQASEQWTAYLMATLMAEPDMMVQFALDLRKREREGIDIGTLAQLLTQGEVVQLALAGAGAVAHSTEGSWVKELADKLEMGRRLSDAEIATLGQISGPGAVEVLATAWDSGKNRDPVIGALVQHRSPESRRLLQRLIFEISDRDLQAALELWLRR